MSDGATTTGLDEFRRAVEQLPAAVTAALRTVAHRSAKNIQGDAKRRLRAQQKTSAHALADLIDVIEDAPNQRFQVISQPPHNEPANVTIWNEHGTSKMGARPYMRPAAEAERAAYAREAQAAVTATAQKVLG